MFWEYAAPGTVPDSSKQGKTTTPYHLHGNRVVKAMNSIPKNLPKFFVDGENHLGCYTLLSKCLMEYGANIQAGTEQTPQFPNTGKGMTILRNTLTPEVTPNGRRNKNWEVKFNRAFTDNFHLAHVLLEMPPAVLWDWYESPLEVAVSVALANLVSHWKGPCEVYEVSPDAACYIRAANYSMERLLLV